MVRVREESGRVRKNAWVRLYTMKESQYIVLIRMAVETCVCFEYRG